MLLIGLPLAGVALAGNPFHHTWNFLHKRILSHTQYFPGMPLPGLGLSPYCLLQLCSSCYGAQAEGSVTTVSLSSLDLGGSGGTCGGLDIGMESI